MPFKRKRPELSITQEVQQKLEQISKSRTESASRIERSKIILEYSKGVTVSAIARQLSTNRPKVERCIDKALQLGALTALDDLPRSGKPPEITPEAKAWLVNLACRKPKELGYSFELWTNRLLAKHAREHCKEHGHPSLENIKRGTVSKILNKSDVRPHKITYYLERRDPDFARKMTQVLHVYKQVELIKQMGKDAPPVTVLSYDEKPGIQAISTVAPDLPPIPGKYSCIARDYEYKRHGTVSLLAGIDLLNGQVHGMVADRHRSREFVQFLKMLDTTYPKDFTIRVILDNHSAHISKETRRYLATVPNRFDFVFTPKHGSWLNIIESLFAKMAKTFLRGIRVASKDDLKKRILKWIEELNESPVVFRWKWRLDTISQQNSLLC
ncbi:MAG: IS630 family transposase [Deltaproteobacteria bacterium]|nr:IS630 family transposase [Deltaproteobacteria bacterium]MBW1910259.1 IS630 family transposase [Deltaproteobacteria bacterium]MBW2169775.1 IS630 family transposase [Deltaproteobacteria bacterium]